MFYLWILAISCFLGGVGTVVIINEEKRERKEERMRERNEVSKKKPYYIPPERMMELRHYCKQIGEIEAKIDSIDSTVKSAMNSVPGGIIITDPVCTAAHKREQLMRRILPYKQACEYLMSCLNRSYDLQTAEDICNMIIIHARTGDGYLTQVAKMGYSPVSKAKYFEYYHWFFYFLDKYRN